MKPIEFYNWAVTTSTSQLPESGQRTVVGRLYYGLHHEACCRYFRENPKANDLKGQERHSELPQRFNAMNDGNAKVIANLLRELKRLRGIADYELAYFPSSRRPRSAHGMMQSALTKAQHLLTALETYSPGEAEDGCLCQIKW